LNDLTDKLNEAKASFALVMVDACRDNPLKVNGRSVGAVRGLSAIEPPKGQMVVYSASKGQQALDRLSDSDNNPNGVFTREFVAKMRQPGVRIEDLMREVQDAVESLAKQVGHDQRPAIYNEARGNFYFFGPTTVQVQSGTATDAETDLWREVKASATRDYLEAYLKQYPKGKYLILAKLELKKLDDTDKAQRPRQEQEQKQAAEQTRLAQLQAADAQQAQAEQQAWADAKASGSPDAYASYLQNYPSGRYATLAQAARLKAQREAAEREKQQAREAEKSAQQETTQREREAQALKAQPASQPASLAMPASSLYGTVGSNPITDCVKDQSTGLTWEGKPSSGERASDKTYSNYGDRRSGDASAYVDTVNAMRLCGYSDWRLPTKDELAGLVVKGVVPTIEGTWFPNTQVSWYWSSTSYGADLALAWGISFSYNYGGGSRNQLGHLRLVR